MSYLKGFYLHFAPKMRNSLTCINLEFHVTFVSRQAGGKKTKACFNLELILGKQISSDSLQQSFCTLKMCHLS